MKTTPLSLKRTFKLVGAQPAALKWGARHRFLVALHFSASAYGKDVRSVRAKVAVLMQEPPCRGGESYWEGTQQVDLQRRGDHYTAKAELTVRSSLVAPRAKGVVSVCHVTFADGTELDTPETNLKLERAQAGLDRSKQEQATVLLQRRFDALVDPRESTCFELVEQDRPTV